MDVHSVIHSLRRTGPLRATRERRDVACYVVVAEIEPALVVMVLAVAIAIVIELQDYIVFQMVKLYYNSGSSSISKPKYRQHDSYGTIVHTLVFEVLGDALASDEAQRVMVVVAVIEAAFVAVAIAIELIVV
ncbi:11448_t:CDS:2, partial [Ambispora gerdemannii]